MDFYCSSCGKKIPSDSKFCSYCGIKIKRIEQTQEVLEGNVHVCPVCHAPIDSFTSKCPYCGHEFRDAQVSRSVTDFSNLLQDLALKERSESTLHTKKLSLIKSYPIPNTKEDLIEFALLCSTNADRNGFPTVYEMEETYAWLEKLKECQKKTLYVFGQNNVYSTINEMYISSRKIARRNRILFYIKAIIVLSLLFLIPFGSFYIACR